MNVVRQLKENQFLVTHIVGPSQNGIRLDAFLKGRYVKKSREDLKRAIRFGQVKVSRRTDKPFEVGKPKPSSQLLEGDQVLVQTERQPEPEVDLNFSTIYEDDHLLVINKPGNLPVHPSGRFFFHTLTTHLQLTGKQTYLVHRIDRETSGILVLAKTKKVCTHVTQQFADREVKKEYLAVVYGTPEKETFSSDVPLLMTREESLIRIKVHPGKLEEGAQTAFTSFKRLQTNGDYTLVRCFPKTGRQHQIRVHLQQAGYPIVGDKLYSLEEEEAVSLFRTSPSPYSLKLKPDEPVVTERFIPERIQKKLVLPRQALHAARLQMTHPVSGKAIEFNAPLPSELQALLF